MSNGQLCKPTFMQKVLTIAVDCDIHRVAGSNPLDVRFSDQWSDAVVGGITYQIRVDVKHRKATPGFWMNVSPYMFNFQSM